jgi:peptidoglycan/xylan/chitin deacetylase (PgdA/CDA1 family)
LGLLDVIRRARLSRGLVVLAYHRIGDPASCPVDETVYCATAEGLRDHARLLLRWSRAARLEEVEERYAAGRPFEGPMVLITFDDVYHDNHETAFPILREAGLPAVFFVPTGLIERCHVPWWDRIAYAVKHSRSDEWRLSYPAGLEVSAVRSNPGTAALALLRRYKREPGLDKERFVAGVEEAAGASAVGAPEVGELFAAWPQLREMAVAGMALGSHTHTHRLLAHLPFEEQREELARSREVLREQDGVDASSIAYPVGARSHFNADTRRAMRETGYRLGFSHYGGWNPAPADPFDIRRIAVDQGVTGELLRASVSLPALFSP